MFVELLETLRCPRPHEETPLVVSASVTRNRYIVDGVLGCAVCGAEFQIRAGITHFAEPEGGSSSQDESPSDEAAMRLAAFLQLTDASTPAALCGRFAAQAERVQRLSDAPLILVNPADAATTFAAASLRVRDVLPVAAGTLRGAAIDEMVSDALAASIVRAVRTRGRIVAPIGVSVPSGVEQLARDALLWVGEKTAAPETAPRLVTLKRAST